MHWLPILRHCMWFSLFCIGASELSLNIVVMSKFIITSISLSNPDYHWKRHPYFCLYIPLLWNLLWLRKVFSPQNGYIFAIFYWRIIVFEKKKSHFRLKVGDIANAPYIIRILFRKSAVVSEQNKQLRKTDFYTDNG